MEFIYFLLSFLFILIVFIAIDYYIIVIKLINVTWVGHFIRFIIRFIIYSFNCYWLHLQNNEEFNLCLFYSSLLLQGALFWFLFDLSLNKLRKKNLFYNGISNPFDKFLNTKSNIFEFTIKLILIILGIIFTYLTNN